MSNWFSICENSTDVQISPMVPVAACRRGCPGAQGINWEKKEEDIVENMDKGLTDAKELEPGEKLLVQKHFPTPPLK